MGGTPSAEPTDRRRDSQLLAVLADGDGERSTAELARTLAARRCGERTVDEEAIRRCRIELRHVRLPKLAADGLVEFDPDAGTVTVGEHTLTPQDSEATGAGEGLSADVLTEGRRSEQRRTVLAALVSDTLDGEATLTELAVAVTAVERDTVADTVGSTVGHTRTTLHHVHLPKLTAAGLIDYDPETRTVTYSGEPTLAAADVDPDVAAELESESGDEVWAVEGEQEVRERGRALFDHADRELFVLVATDGQLSAPGVDRLAAALERGADVYVGTGDGAVRDRVCDAVPGATVWEPRRGWLDRTPARGGRLGRLVVADRQAVLLGTLRSGPDDGYGERGVTGDGTRNPLVVLARDLLRSRLDRIRGDADGRPAVPF